MSRPALEDFLDFGSPADYRRLELPEGPAEGAGGGLELPAAALEALAEAAFSEIAYRLPISQAEGLASVLAAPDASPADRFVAASLLRNAAIAAEGLYPLCQDTGVALVFGWKGEGLRMVGGGDAEALDRGARAAYSAHRLRASILEPTSFLSERNSGDNGPACLDLRAAPGSEYRLCFAAKGGGSANRTSLSMETPALLDEARLSTRLERLVQKLGAGACPPYRIAAVLGGESPDEALYALSLASLGLLDRLPLEGEGLGSGEGARALRSPLWEGRILAFAAASGVGAQFGGTKLALSCRALRLARHAASLPLAFGVSCSALRRARAIASREGLFLERLEEDPGRFLPKEEPLLEGALRVDLDKPIAELASELRRLKPGSPLLLSGTAVTARDAVHARLRALMAAGRPLPSYALERPLFYAGPTEAAPGQASGSFGPTTASRMDPYLPELLSRGASLVSIAKGGRSADANEAIRRGGGAYLATIGGAAALAGREHVLSSEVIDYPELGMEAVRRVVLRELPAILVSGSSGADFYSSCGPAAAGRKV